MKITGIKSIMIQGIPWTWTLVKVETDEGIYGIGEAQLPIGVRDVFKTIEGIIVGEDPRHPVRLGQKIYRGLIGAGSMGGSIGLGLSGVELALWGSAVMPIRPGLAIDPPRPMPRECASG